MQPKLFFSQALLGAMCLFATIAAVSCRKGPGEIPLPDFDGYASQMQAQQAVSTLQDLVYEAISLSSDLYDGDGTVTLSQCPQITLAKAYPTSSYPATLTIDASGGCLWRGHQLSGKVTLSLDKALSAGNATLSGTVAGFSIDQSTLDGNAALQFGAADKPFASMSLTLSNFEVAKSTGDAVRFDAMTANRTQTAGQLTVVRTGGKPALDDDVFVIQVAGNGTANDLAFTVQTETPVTRSMDCRWIALGKITVDMGPSSGYIDFGNGNCDNQVLIKVGEEERTFNLR
jgi:hypothetical protein